MKFKLDENIPLDCVKLFKKAEIIVKTVFDEGLQGENDTVVYNTCLREEEILVTLDLDFSDIRLYPPGEHYGIIVIRLNDQSKNNILQKVRKMIPVLKKEKIEGNIWIVDENKIRIREKN